MRMLKREKKKGKERGNNNRKYGVYVKNGKEKKKWKKWMTIDVYRAVTILFLYKNNEPMSLTKFDQASYLLSDCNKVCRLFVNVFVVIRGKPKLWFFQSL